MAYTPVTFVYGETLTSTKMNILAANDASFHDGSGLPAISASMLASNAVTTAKINALAVTEAKIADSAVSASKLNLTTLYSNTTGSTNFTLSDSVANYQYIMIFFKTNDGLVSSEIVQGGQNFITDLGGYQINTSTGGVFTKISIFSFSGTTVSYQGTERHGEISITSQGAISITSTNNVLITKVIGIK